jgi:hypothetical protein
MGRGLDGYFLIPGVGMLCSFQGPHARGPRRHNRRPPPAGLAQFPVALAWGKHLFPFRTEQLSPTAPMVLGLRGPGRVGRRRFFSIEPPTGRLDVVNARRSRLGRTWASAAPPADVNGGLGRRGFGRVLGLTVLPSGRIATPRQEGTSKLARCAGRRRGIAVSAAAVRTHPYPAAVDVRSRPRRPAAAGGGRASAPHKRAGRPIRAARRQ